MSIPEQRGLLAGEVSEFTARRVRERIVAGEHEAVIAQLAEEIDMARGSKGGDDGAAARKAAAKAAADKAAQDAADAAAERGRKLNEELARDVRRRQAEANRENRQNWS